MATLAETDYTKLSTDAADRFVDLYYSALDSHRSTLQSFYVPTLTQDSGRGLPSITYNGELISDSASFQERWENHMPRTSIQIQSVNAHVLNPVLAPWPGDAKKRDAEKNVSLIVQVSGTVRLGEPKEGPLRAFGDSFVLVPNTEVATGVGGKEGAGGKRWLIQSQAFRFVV